MKRSHLGRLILASGLLIGTAMLNAQSSSPGNGQPLGQSAGEANPATGMGAGTQTGTAQRKRHAARGREHVVPMESTANGAPNAPAQTSAAAKAAQQRAADQKLLEQQQAQSDRAAQITNQQVRNAQKQQDTLQNENRIQDAPGPAQTGVVPAAGSPVQPNSPSGQRIQDAPGPAQTLPQTMPQTNPQTMPPVSNPNGAPYQSQPPANTSQPPNL